MQHKYKLTIVPHFGLAEEQKGLLSPGTALALPPYIWKGRKIMAFTMKDTQQVTCTLAFTDKKGNPATLPAGTTPQWLNDGTAILTLTFSTDGLSCVVAAAGPLGTATISVKVMDPASGNAIASGSLDFTIVGSALVNVVITPGTPTNQP